METFYGCKLFKNILPWMSQVRWIGGFEVIKSTVTPPPPRRTLTLDLGMADLACLVHISPLTCAVYS